MLAPGGRRREAGDGTPSATSPALNSGIADFLSTSKVGLLNWAVRILLPPDGNDTESGHHQVAVSRCATGVVQATGTGGGGPATFSPPSASTPFARIVSTNVSRLV